MLENICIHIFVIDSVSFFIQRICVTFEITRLYNDVLQFLRQLDGMHKIYVVNTYCIIRVIQRFKIKYLWKAFFKAEFINCDQFINSNIFITLIFLNF